MTWYVGLVDFSCRAEVQQDGRCVRRYMRKYLVRTDAATFQEEPAVFTAVGIVRGSVLSADTNATCMSGEVTPGPVMTRAPHLAYFATYEFATNASVPADDDDDPTTTRTIWSISPQIQTRYIIKDRDGKLIVNGAGQPFDGGIPVDVRLGSVTAKRNKTAVGYDRDAVLANSGKLNSATFLGGAAGSVQVDISAVEKYEGAYHFWEETYTFSYDPLGWQPKPANVGFFQRHSVDSDCLKRILSGDLVSDTCSGTDADENPHVPVQEPEPLDEDGILVPIDERPDGCTFIEVDYYDTMDFNSFGL